MGTTISGESNIRQIVVGPRDDPQGPRLRDGHVPRRGGVHPPAGPADGRPGRLPLRQPGPVGHVGSGGHPGAGVQRDPLERDRRHHDSLRPAEPAVRLCARLEAACGVAGVQEAPGLGQAAAFHLGGIRLGVAGAARLSDDPGEVQGHRRPEAGRVRHAQGVPGQVRGRAARKPSILPMDAWNKSLTWGLGGDQVRVLDRKVEGLLLAAELFDAVAVAPRGQVAGGTAGEGMEGPLGLAEPRRGALRVLALAGRPHGPLRPDRGLSQLHLGRDRLQPPRRRPETGAGRPRRRPRSRSRSGSTRKAASTGSWPSPCSIRTPGSGPTWRRRGRIYPIAREGRRESSSRTAPGRVVPSQTRQERQGQGGQPGRGRGGLPGKGLSRRPATTPITWSWHAQPRGPPSPTGLRVDEAKLVLENEHRPRRARSRDRGAWPASSTRSPGARRSTASRGAFPHFTGRPNPNLSLKPSPPARYDSATSKGQLDWLAKGPLLATLRAQHHWPYLTFETRVTLAAGLARLWRWSRACWPWCRRTPTPRPPDIKEGYWVSLGLAFEPATVLRDYPVRRRAHRRSRPSTP